MGFFEPFVDLQKSSSSCRAGLVYLLEGFWAGCGIFLIVWAPLFSMNFVYSYTYNLLKQIGVSVYFVNFLNQTLWQPVVLTKEC